MPQSCFGSDIQAHFSRHFHFGDARGRPQVITDAVGTTETGKRNDFFVVNAFILVTRFRSVRDVAFGWDRPEFQVRKHN